jgi:nicotinate-nucleotide pyrophosphorylase (carboxylating)
VFGTGPPDAEYIRTLIADALAEDGAGNDSTVSFLELGDRSLCGRLVVRAPGVIAGIDVARMTFAALDPAIEFDARVADGDRVQPDQSLAQVLGRAPAVLSAERVALNFLQSLSGIATLTAQFVNKVQGTGVTILDTRKTTPLFRELQRYAVRVGGGANHRFNLTDMILIKENHIRALGGLQATRDYLSRKSADRTIEVEVDTMDDLRQILGCPIDQIMLDNFSPQDVARAIDEVRAYRDKHPSFAPTIEMSGGIHLGNVGAYAIAGVDYISVGALTHSAPALDISLEVVPNGP